MKEPNVPQDSSPTYGGHQKLLYAIDEQGQYKGVRSSGWESEASATHNAIDEINRLRIDAWERARQGETAPLEYYMYLRRMDLVVLSQTTGFFKWRIKRHFDSARFAKLPPRVLSRYVEALEIDAEMLRQLPTEP